MTIRICEWKDAERMLKDGTFVGFVQMWLDRYPYRGRMKQVKEYKEMFGCSFKEASHRWHYGPEPLDMDFEIGEAYILRREGCQYRLLYRKDGLMTMYQECLALKDLPHLLKNPEKVTYESVCDKKELMEEGKAGRLGRLARHLEATFAKRSYDMRGGKTLDRPFLFCGEEIWREKWEYLEDHGKMSWRLWLVIARKGGEEMIDPGSDAIEEYLNKYYQRQLVTRGAF